MSLFIGVKMIKAEAMTRAEYNDYRNWPMPEDEDGRRQDTYRLAGFTDRHAG